MAKPVHTGHGHFWNLAGVPYAYLLSVARTRIGMPSDALVPWTLANRTLFRIGPIENRGGRVIHSSAVDGLKRWDGEDFDVIMMISYLEHEAQPLPVLREIKRLLRSDGHCLIKVPNYACWNRRVRGKQWCGFRYPDHVNYFTPATLRVACNSAGLRVSQAWSDRNPLSDNMYAILTPAGNGWADDNGADVASRGP